MAHRSLVRLLVQPMAIAVVLAFATRSVVRVYSIPSRSMQPTLVAGDRIAVTPYWHAQPRRGDVVVFHSPGDPSEYLVKRVIALPGDLIGTTGGAVTIGGRPLPEPYLESGATTASIALQIVPHDCYFVMGDNRLSSLDSRSWGVLPRALLVGRARMVLWSASGTASAPAAFASGNDTVHDPRRHERLRLLLPIR